jgi:hypothetical protein
MNKFISPLLLILVIFLTYLISDQMDGSLGYGYMKFTIILSLIGGVIFYFLSKKDNSKKYEDVIVSSYITFDPYPVKNKNIVNSFGISFFVYFSLILFWKVLYIIFDYPFIVDLTNNGSGWILTLVFVWYTTSLFGSFIWGCSKGKVFRIIGVYTFITVTFIFGLYGYFEKFVGLG